MNRETNREALKNETNKEALRKETGLFKTVGDVENHLKDIESTENSWNQGFICGLAHAGVLTEDQENSLIDRFLIDEEEIDIENISTLLITSNGKILLEICGPGDSRTPKGHVHVRGETKVRSINEKDAETLDSVLLELS